MALEWQASTLKQAEQVEFGLGLHVVEHLFGREIVNPNDDIGGEIAKSLRQAPKHLAGQDFEFGQRRRLGGAGGVPRLGSAIGEVCCACARGLAASSAAQTNMMARGSLLIEAVYLFPLIPAQAGIQSLGPRLRGDER